MIFDALRVWYDNHLNLKAKRGYRSWMANTFFAVDVGFGPSMACARMAAVGIDEPPSRPTVYLSQEQRKELAANLSECQGYHCCCLVLDYPFEEELDRV